MPNLPPLLQEAPDPARVPPAAMIGPGTPLETAPLETTPLDSWLLEALAQLAELHSRMVDAGSRLAALRAGPDVPTVQRRVGAMAMAAHRAMQAERDEAEQAASGLLTAARTEARRIIEAAHEGPAPLGEPLRLAQGDGAEPPRTGVRACAGPRLLHPAAN